MPVSVIRAFRLAAKLPQADFANQLGVSKETYRAWDSNRRQPPSEIIDKARAVAARGSRDQLLGLPHRDAIVLEHVAVGPEPLLLPALQYVLERRRNRQHPTHLRLRPRWR